MALVLQVNVTEEKLSMTHQSLGGVDSRKNLYFNTVTQPMIPVLCIPKDEYELIKGEDDILYIKWKL